MVYPVRPGPRSVKLKRLVKMLIERKSISSNIGDGNGDPNFITNLFKLLNSFEQVHFFLCIFSIEMVYPVRPGPRSIKLKRMTKLIIVRTGRANPIDSPEHTYRNENFSNDEDTLARSSSP